MAQDQKQQNQGQQKATQQKAQPKKQTSRAAKHPPVLRDIVDRSLQRIQQLKELNALNIPEDYSPQNAIRSAAFIIQDKKDKNNKPVLEVCTKESIMNSLLDMVVQGLNPMKHQCSFIPRGNQLTSQREYAGTLALAKRFGGVKFVNANVIYEDDKFSYSIDAETGYKEINEHQQDIDNIDINKIKGGYALVHHEGSEKPYVEIMTISQIRQAWNQGDMKGKSPAHQNFTDQMVKKTLYNRACKGFINSSDDAPIVEKENQDHHKEAVQAEIHENANQEEIENPGEGEPEPNQKKDSDEGQVVVDNRDKAQSADKQEEKSQQEEQKPEPEF